MPQSGKKQANGGAKAVAPPASAAAINQPSPATKPNQSAPLTVDFTQTPELQRQSTPTRKTSGMGLVPPAITVIASSPQVNQQQQSSSPAVGAGGLGRLPSSLVDPASAQPSSPANSWKTVGANRRASFNVPSVPYFVRKPSVVVGNDGGAGGAADQSSSQPTPLSAINERHSSPVDSSNPSTVHTPIAQPPLQDTPSRGPPARIYEFFGGRSHGARSLSFSIGQPTDELLMPPAPPPGLGASQQATSNSIDAEMEAVASRLNNELNIDELGSSPMWQQRDASPATAGRYYQPLLDPQQRQQLLHRRTSTFSGGPVQTGWGVGLQLGHGMSASNPSSARFNDQQPQFGRRFTVTNASGISDSVHTPETDEIAAKYFNRDPALNNRRHSLAAAMALRSPGGVESPAQLADFAQQYGNMIDNDRISPVDLMPPSNNFLSVDTTTTNPDKRVRAWSEPPVDGAGYVNARSPGASLAISPSSPNRPTTNLFVLEFKGGRSDVFYVPEGSELMVRKGDLVIVEADRGKDLGKVIRAHLPHHELLDPATGKQLQPKLIYRHAQPPEVNMLLDKARDEAKALSICQAKCRQKGIKMEVVDAEYQWDRKKLTFYFLAEQRIDFRDLVKDLFKIYKARIWMCAVERNRTNTHLKGYDEPI